MNYFERNLNYNGILFELSDKFPPDEREIHTYHEILYLIEGDAELLTENSRLNLKNQTLIIIPKGTYHFFRMNGKRFYRLKITIPETSEGSLPPGDFMKNFYLSDVSSKGINFSLEKLTKILQDKDAVQRGFHAYAAYLMLVSELDTLLENEEILFSVQHGIVPLISKYISRNLSGDLSVSKLSDALNISPSGITHGFKKELGISLHNYITQRRLIYAKELILAGNKPSKIYTDCGYMEYSSFYRAYVKFFGYPPSAEKGDI